MTNFQKGSVSIHISLLQVHDYQLLYTLEGSLVSLGYFNCVAALRYLPQKVLEIQLSPLEVFT